MNEILVRASIDAADRRLVRATQEGLPLVPRPYHRVADELGLAPAEVMARFERMLAAGVVRRFGAIPNHYRIGYRHNGMSVWDVPESEIVCAGSRIGALEFVSHCYQRPRRGPDWPFNLFAMVHGRDRAEVEEKVAVIARELRDIERGHAVLYSVRILKKTGLRFPD